MVLNQQFLDDSSMFSLNPTKFYNTRDPTTFHSMSSSFVWGPQYSQYIACSIQTHRWGLPQMEVSQNGWFIMEHPIKTNHLGVHLFQETTTHIYIYIHIIIITYHLGCFIAPIKNGDNLGIDYYQVYHIIQIEHIMVYHIIYNLPMVYGRYIYS